MFSKKIFISAALASMAGLVACGDDSSSNAVDSSDSNESTITSSNSVETPSSESKGSDSTPESSSTSSGSTVTSSDEAASSESATTAKVSCDNLPEEGQEAFGTMGEKCTEFEKGTMAASALELRCEDRGGTLGTGCPAKENKNNGNCIDKSQCNAMVKTDISTWHFTRADAFGEPSVYIYSVADNGTDLIVSIDGKEKSYSMYNMSSEVGVEMAFSAAKATCNDGMEVEGANYCD